MKYLNYLKEISKIKKEGIEIIKVGIAYRLPLIKIILNKSGKRTVCFSAGIHGEEIAGPLAVLEFLKRYNAKEFPNIKIILFPVVNPSGFDKEERLNKEGINLNQSFLEKNIPKEDKIFYNEIKKEKIFFFHALHEDSDEKRFYLYNFEKRFEKVYRKIISLAKKFFPINLEKIIDHAPASKGMITNKPDKSFEYRLYKEKKTKYSLCTETPMKQSLKKRIRLNVEIMRLILNFVKK